MINRVLVLSASAGAGHVRAAEAIVAAFNERGAAVEVRHVDTLEYTTRLFRNLYSKAYFDMAKRAPEVMGWLYDQYDRPWKSDPLRIAFEKLNTARFVKMLRTFNPDFVVCTHFLPAEIIAYLRHHGKIRYRQSIVVTDFDVHAFWLCRHFERYYVPIDETREHLQALGIPPERLTVTGIPIDPLFLQTKDKIEMRRRHELREDRLTILVSAGGVGVGPVEHIVQSFAHLERPAQIAVMCGRNNELRERVEAASAAFDRERLDVRAIGFTTEMDEYMSASDILVGKPGGLTTSESLARGLVMVIVNPIPGQEERNADHLLEEGAALRCNNLPVLAWKIDRLLDDPERFAAMGANVRRLARPDAAFRVVDGVLADAAAGLMNPELEVG